MKPKKFLEAASVRFQSSPGYPMLSDQSRTFFLNILPWFNHPHLQDTPGLLLTPDGSPVTIPELSSTVNQIPDDTLAGIKELARHGFLTTDDCGAIACPIATEVLSRHRFFVEAGKRGGNPKLKQGTGNEKKATPYPTPLPNPPSKATTRKQKRDESAFLKLKTPPTSPYVLPTNPIYIKATPPETTINPLDFAQIASEIFAKLGEFSFSVEGIFGGQPFSAKGLISPKTNPYANPQTKGYANPKAYPLNDTQTYEKQEVGVDGYKRGLAGGLGVGLTPGVGGGVRGRVNPHFERQFSRSHAYARHARGSHGSLREPVLSTNNTLRVLKPYLTKYNCATNVARSLCELGGAGGIFEKTSNSPDEPGVARPTTLPIHETKTVANLDSLTANRPEQLFSPGSGFDGGTVPIANRTERTPATTEPVAAETRPTAFAPVPRFEHSLPADPALEGNDAGSKKPFVLKVLPIPNPFSSHPDVAKGDPELAASLLNGGFPPTKTPSLTTHDRKHEETTPPSCAPPPPPCPVFLDDEPVSEWHAPSPSDFVECPDVEDFDPAELYDETTPIEDFDPSDPAGMSEPDDEDFAPMFDPPEISGVKTVSTAPEAISDAKTTPDESSPTLMLQNASTGFKRPAIAILNSTSEKTCAGFDGNSNLDQNSDQSSDRNPDKTIEKENPGIETVSVVVATEKPSNPVPVQASLLATAETGPAEVPAPPKETKPKRAKKAKKAENPDDPAQAEYLANYHRLLKFYGDKIKAKIPNHAAQGAAVKWLLQQGGYTPDECEECLVDQFENWTKGSPSWLTVKAHIAAWKLRKENPVQPKPAPRQSRPFYDNRDDRRRDRAPSPTQQIHNIVRVVDSAADQVDLSDPDSIVPAPPVVEEVVIPCSVPNIDACLNMLRRFHAMAIHVKKTGGIPVTTNMNHVGANWVYAQCKFPLDLETLSFEEIEKRYRHHHARLATALTKQAQIGNGTPAQNPQSAQSAQSAHPVQKPQNATPKGVVNG